MAFVNLTLPELVIHRDAMMDTKKRIEGMLDPFLDQTATDVIKRLQDDIDIANRLIKRVKK